MTKLGPLTVSRQGFGAMGLSSSYGRADDAESIKTLHRAIELGVTLFDTATAYGAGHNETLLGQAVADRRDGLVIASKFVHRAAGSDAVPVRAKDAVENSLKRLGLKVIDLYYLHRIDPRHPGGRVGGRTGAPGRGGEHPRHRPVGGQRRPTQTGPRRPPHRRSAERVFPVDPGRGGRNPARGPRAWNRFRRL